MVYQHTCSQHAECSAVFDQKWHDPHVPPSLFTQSHHEGHFLFPWMEKAFEWNLFANVEEMKQNTAEVLKGIKIDEFKNSFEQWKKCLQRHIASNGEDLEGDWSLSI